jgi:hypothetical protein
MSSQVSTDAASPRPLPADPATAPLSGPRRLGLLVILLILPVICVSLPAIFVTLVFGQRPRPPAPAVATDVSGLRTALERNAEGVLPAPAALAADPIVLTVRAEHVAARAARVMALARQYGGSAAEGLPQEGEKDIYADVPLAASPAFQEAVKTPSRGAAALPSPPASAAAAPDSKTAPALDHVEIIIRAAADDE